ncbi:LOW QUALITY PROTEIN: transmembrane prolyl 4-hydroxylase-like [Lampetra planeri]
MGRTDGGVCSRAYFVAVMVFAHVYILNIIVLLMYVHYSGGPRGDPPEPHAEGSAPPPPTTGPGGHQGDEQRGSRLPPFQLPRMEGIKVGHVRASHLVPGVLSHVTTLSLKPLLFEVSAMLSLAECRELEELARRAGLHEVRAPPAGSHDAATGDDAAAAADAHRTNAWNAWLNQRAGAPQVLRSLSDRVVHLTGLPRALVEAGEPVQVHVLAEGGHERAHRDSGATDARTVCAHTRMLAQHHHTAETPCRYVTVLVFLNDVEEGGETAFPAADNRTFDSSDLVRGDVDMSDMRAHCSRANLRVTPHAGSALLWYNHLSDGRGWVGELDDYSLQGDCAVVRGARWTARLWVNVDPDAQRQSRLLDPAWPGQRDPVRPAHPDSAWPGLKPQSWGPGHDEVPPPPPPSSSAGAAPDGRSEL